MYKRSRTYPQADQLAQGWETAGQIESVVASVTGRGKLAWLSWGRAKATFDANLRRLTPLREAAGMRALALGAEGSYAWD